MKKTSSALIAVVLAALLIWGCGGGGGGGDMMAPPPGTGTIQGSVRDDINAPVAGATTRLRNRGSTSNLSSQVTGVDGSYTFSGVEPGDYDIFLDVPSGFALNGQTNPVMVSVTAGQTSPANFTIQLTAAGTVSGTATEGANPVLGATAALRNPGSATNLRVTTTDAGGAYTFTRVAVGDYDVFLTPPSGFSVDPPNPVRVTVTDGGTAQADFALSVALVSFANDVQPVFNSKCAFSGCHGSFNANPIQKPMILVAGQAYANIVNVSAFQPLPTMDRIEPGDPDNSYLIHKIQGTQGSVGGSGGRMPLGQPALPQTTIDLIRLWVSQGAADN